MFVYLLFIFINLIKIIKLTNHNILTFYLNNYFYLNLLCVNIITMTSNKTILFNNLIELINQSK